MKNDGRNGGSLKWLSERLRRHLPAIAVLCVMLAAVSVLSVSMSLFMARAIDSAGKSITSVKAGGDPVTGPIVKFLVIMAAVTLAAILLRFFAKLLQARVQQRMEMTLRSSLLSGIISRDYGRVTAYHSGDLLNRLTNDSGVVATAAATILPSLAELVARLVFAFAMLLYFDWVFAALAIGAALFVFIGSLFFRPLLKRLHKRVQETEGDTRSFMQEVIENQLVVRVFGAEQRIMSRTDDLQERSFAAAMRKRFVSVSAGEGISFVFTIGTIAALCWGVLSLAGVFGSERAITYGTLAAVLQLVSQVQSPFARLSGLLPQFFAMTASAERLMEIERLPEEQGAGEEEPCRDFESIDIDNVSFAYLKRGAKKEDEGAEISVLNEASAHIAKGDFIAITGISGIGKSTLMKLLMGVYRPVSGSITVNTAGGARPADASTRGLFAYVPQGNLLLSGTVRENITFMREGISDESIMRAARIACADEFINELPHGLDTVIGEHGHGLSEGQAQRLAVARAVLTEAPVLLLDEATSALDADTEKLLLSRLKETNSSTVLIVTHKPAALSVCGREMRIVDGKITFQ